MRLEVTGYPTQRLVRMLAEQHDDGDPGTYGLHVERGGETYSGRYVLHVTRADGSELSASERAHVAAILAAHAAEPIE